MTQVAVPNLDDALRRRMVARFGSEVESWLDELPPVLATVAERWQVNLDALIPRGHMSVVIQCRTTDGTLAVLKVCYDRARLTLLDELYNADPPLPDEMINRERLELEEAIRKVEVESLRRALAEMSTPRPQEAGTSDLDVSSHQLPNWLTNRAG